MKHPILGQTRPYWASQLLGTGFEHFASPYGIVGLAKETTLGLEILALNATKPRTGQLRKFISACKEWRYSVYVWNIWNPIVSDFLKSQGFVEISHPDPDTGEPMKGMVYKK